MSMLDAINYIQWTVDRSQKAYELHRNNLIELRVFLVNAELKYLREKKDVGHKSNAPEGGCEDKTLASGHGGDNGTARSVGRIFKPGVM